MDQALYQQLEQERLLNQVTGQIRQSLELSVILSTAVERLQQYLQVDRLLIYQFDFQWSVPPGECSLEPGWDMEERESDPRLIRFPAFSDETPGNGKANRGCVTYEARSSDQILSVLHLSEADSCFFENPEIQAKYHKSHASFWVEDVEKTYASSPCFLEFLRRIQVRAKVVFSIVVQEKLWGLLIAHQCFQPRHWTEDETKFIAQVTEHLSIAIYQSQLYTQLQQQKHSLERRVTERTQALHDALLAAQSANRAKSEFLATMSHELRTPLTCVIGISATLLRLYSNGGADSKQLPVEKQQEYLRKIHDSGEHLLELINDILELSQVEAGKTVLQIGEFSLGKFIQHCLHSFREKAQNSGILLAGDIQIKPSQDRFAADQRRLQQILFNLLSNAIKFTPEGGQVTLRVRVDGNTAIFQIEDTGIGIPKEQQPLLFEKFQQLDSSYRRQYGGTGLGLALTKQLVELHGGAIKFTSTERVGSTFTVHIPAQPLPSSNSQQRVKNSAFKTSLPTADANNSLSRFVLIENDEETATLICEILTAAGYQVVWLVEGLTALGQIKLLQPAAVIIDMHLPGQDGYEIIRHLKNTKATQHIKILAIANGPEFSPSESGLIPEADDWIAKPIKPNQLLNKILSWDLENGWV